MTDKIEAPECEKMQAVQGKSQAIGEFLDWLTSTKGVSLMVDYTPTDDEEDAEGMPYPDYVPLRMGTEKLLAEFFGIDLKKVEEERQAMLAQLRGDNNG